MTILWSNNASTTLSGSITAVSTSVALSAGTGILFPVPSGSDYFVATFYDQATKTQFEIVHVTSVVGDIATIVRAQEGTTARAWSAGDLFANLVTAGTLRNFVQSGAGPADTSIVYVGTDVSITPGLIVCNTVPVPANYSTGMLFNIKVNNTNLGPVQLQLNGKAAVTATRTDGSAMVGGNLVATEEMAFIFNGVNFTSLVPPIPQGPPQTTFYVRPDGNDNNSGFANTPAAAFATISGGMHNIEARYISQGTITIRVADGSYIDGFEAIDSYIANWNIIGNPANPGNVIINATATTQAAYPSPYAVVGGSCGVGGSGSMTVNGFTFQSWYGNVSTSGGTLGVSNCHFNSTVQAGGVITSGRSGTLYLSGNCQYTGAGSAGAIFDVNVSGNITLAGVDLTGSTPLNFNIVGTPTITQATAVASSGGVIDTYDAYMTFTGGVPNCKRFICQSGGGISFLYGNTAIFPGTQAGTVTAPGWTD